MATCPICRTVYADDVAVCAKDGEPLLHDEAFAGVDRDLSEGDQVGEYRVDGLLGRGGFGTVYKATHPIIGKAAAIKVLSRQFSSNPQMVSRFIAEARAVNQVRHRNIVDIFAFGVLGDGRHYYVMELLEGDSLEHYLSERGRLSVETAIAILRGVARALDAAHAAGLAHRDLKPENVFIVSDDDGGIRPKLLDFGIAKLLSDSSGGHKTKTGAPLGTPAYMSPEQCRGLNVDARTDVYSLGVLCHKLLTGRQLFAAESVVDLLFQHTHAPPPRLSEHCPSLPPSLDASVLQMLEKDPSTRPATAGGAIDALAIAASHAGFDVAPTPAASGPSVRGPRPEAGPDDPTLPLVTTGSGRFVSSAEARQLELARTISRGSASGRTLTPAETFVAARPRRTLVVVLAGAAVAAFVAVVGLAARGSPGDREASAREMSAPAKVLAVSPTPPSSTESAPDVPAPVASVVPITVNTTPRRAEVFMGTTRLGEAPGPFLLPRGAQVATLTVRAPGYQPVAVDVVPNAGATVSATLVKTPSSGKKPVTSRELENPF